MGKLIVPKKPRLVLPAEDYEPSQRGLTLWRNAAAYIVLPAAPLVPISYFVYSPGAMDALQITLNYAVSGFPASFYGVIIGLALLGSALAAAIGYGVRAIRTRKIRLRDDGHPTITLGHDEYTVNDGPT